MRFLRRTHAVALVLSSALLSRACGPPFELAPLAFLSWLPLLLVLGRVSAVSGALLGLVQGVATNVLAFLWMVPAVHRVAGISWPGALGALGLLCVGQGLRASLLSLGYRVLVIDAGLFRPVAFGAWLALVESVFPMVFAWGSYGLLYAAPIWTQLASIGGATLVTVSIGFVNEALAMAIAQGRRRRWYALLLAAAALSALSLFGWWRLRSVDAETAKAQRSKALVVQGNLLAAELEQRDPAAVYREATLRALAEHPGAEWIVWPETAVFYGTEAQRLPELFRDVLTRDPASGVASPRIALPLVLGVVVEEGAKRFNSVVAAAPGGTLTGRYDKRLLVPFGEGPRARGRAGRFASSPGVNQAPLDVNGRAVGTIICFEALDSERVRDAMSFGRAQLLLNPTSDAWFSGSIGPRMHLAMVAIRAVEHGRYLLRPTTSGVSALIDPGGRLVWELPEGRTAAGIAEFSWMQPVTLFTRLGTLPTTIALGVLCALSALLCRRRRRHSLQRPAPTPST